MGSPASKFRARKTRSRLAVSAVIGGVIIFAIVFTVFAAYFVSIQHASNQSSQINQQISQEALNVTVTRQTGSLVATVNDAGPSTVKIVEVITGNATNNNVLSISNTSTTQTLPIGINPGNNQSIPTNYALSKPGNYWVKVVTSLGTVGIGTFQWATPTMATVLSSQPTKAGQPVHDSATLSGATSSAGGTVTYNWYSGGTCTGTPTKVGSQVAVTNAMVPNSTSVIFNLVGTYSWNANYSGDSNNQGPVISQCELLTVTASAPAISTSLSFTSIVAGQSVYDSAILSGATNTAGGTVTYYYYASSSCSAGAVPVSTVTVTNGVVPNSASQPFITVGSYGWDAVYSGDANNAGPVTSPCEPLTVTKAFPSLTTTISPFPTVPIGSSVTDLATLIGTAPSPPGVTGTITYNFYSNGACTGAITTTQTLTIGAGGAIPSSNPITPAASGTYGFQAVYSGDANNNPATGACEPLTVQKVTPTITTDLSSAAVIVGSSVYDSATLTGVTPSAGGTVQYYFFSSSTCSGTGTPVGSAVTVANSVVPNSISEIFPSVGSFGWDAVYSGDANNAGPVTSACEPLNVQSVSSISTILAAPSIAINGSVKDTAYLSGVTSSASGNISFWWSLVNACPTSGATLFSSVPVTPGILTYPSSPSQPLSTPGVYYVYAIYTGDAQNTGTTSPCEALTVGLAITTSLSSG